MKKLSLFSLIIGVSCLLATLSNQRYFISRANSLEFFENMRDRWDGPGLSAEISHLTIVLDEIVLITSGVIFLLVVFPIFRTRSKHAFVAIFKALTGMNLGLAQGTHMCSKN